MTKSKKEKKKYLPNEKEYVYWRDRLAIIVKEFGVGSAFRNDNIQIECLRDSCSIQFRNKLIFLAVKSGGNIVWERDVCNNLHDVYYSESSAARVSPVEYIIENETYLSKVAIEYIDFLYSKANEKRKLKETISKIKKSIRIAEDKIRNTDLEVELSLFGGHKEPEKDKTQEKIDASIKNHEDLHHEELDEVEKKERYKAEPIYSNETDMGLSSMTTQYRRIVGERYKNPSRLIAGIVALFSNKQIKTMEIIYK